eukprot:1017069-Pleurochrysis_carterae.AAC.1
MTEAAGQALPKVVVTAEEMATAALLDDGVDRGVFGAFDGFGRRSGGRNGGRKGSMGLGTRLGAGARIPTGVLKIGAGGIGGFGEEKAGVLDGGDWNCVGGGEEGPGGCKKFIGGFGIGGRVKDGGCGLGGKEVDVGGVLGAGGWFS